MKRKNHRHWVAVSALAAALATPSACNSSRSDDTRVQGEVVLIDGTAQTLLAADLLSVDGSYGSDCHERANMTWRARISGPVIPAAERLRVVRHDVDCVLTLTGLVTTAGLRAVPVPFVLTESYAGTASPFGTPVEFYANAKLSADALLFDADFVVTILYSEETFANEDITAAFAVSESSVIGAAVPAPNNALDLSAFDVLTDVDDVIEAVTGTIGLSATTQGQDYVVLGGGGLTDYADIEAAFDGATAEAWAANIPATEFDALLMGQDLTGVPIVLTLIFRNTVEDISSYQLFEITFHEPV